MARSAPTIASSGPTSATERNGERSQSTTSINAAEAISEKGTIVTRMFVLVSEKTERRVLSRGSRAHACEHAAGALAVQGRRDRAGGGGGERHDRDVVGDSQGWSLLEHLRDRRRETDNEQSRSPAEEHDRGDAEDERERDPAGVDPLDRDGKAVGQGRGAQQRRKPEDRRGLVRRDRERDRSSTRYAEACNADRGNDCKDARRRQDAVCHY